MEKIFTKKIKRNNLNFFVTDNTYHNDVIFTADDLRSLCCYKTWNYVIVNYRWTLDTVTYENSCIWIILTPPPVGSLYPDPVVSYVLSSMLWQCEFRFQGNGDLIYFYSKDRGNDIITKITDIEFILIGGSDKLDK